MKERFQTCAICGEKVRNEMPYLLAHSEQHRKNGDLLGDPGYEEFMRNQKGAR